MERFTKHLLVRYILSGGTAAVVNLGIFFVLYYFLGFYYILASILSFVVAFCVSLILQKFWTFKDHSMDGFHAQVGKYFVVALIGLAVNTAVLYVCVEYLGAHKMVGQFVAGIVAAFCTFPISRDHVFNQQNRLKTG